MYIYAFALFASVGAASILARDVSKFCKKHLAQCAENHLSSICAPNLNSANIDLNIPCNIQQYLLVECAYGAKPNISKFGIEIPNGVMQSNDTQRLCICESQYFEVLEGCESCFQKHGAGVGLGVSDYIPNNIISSMSSAYCAASPTPTLGFFDYQLLYVSKPQFSSILSSTTGTAKSTFSDPLGNKTAVSLYYTASVTGSAALDVGEFLTTGTVKPTTTSLKDGEIVATASANAATKAATSTQTTTGAQTGASTGASTTTTSGIAARQTEAVFAGVLGLVGVVAML